MRDCGRSPEEMLRDAGPRERPVTERRDRATADLSLSRTLGLERVRVPKASDVLADQLRHRILMGDLIEGEVLPPERDLVEESGLSRTAVREALRILEIEGIIATKPGRAGGSVVQRPDFQSVARSVDVFIRGRRLQLHSLLETREAIEPAAARLAAHNRTDHDLVELSRCNDRLQKAYSDVDAYLTANVAWHLEVVRASHNELLIAIMAAISPAVHAATDVADFNSDAVRSAALVAHDGVFEAIRDRDEDAAHRRMARHVSAYSEQVLVASSDKEISLDETDQHS